MNERSDDELMETNRAFYDPLWSDSKLIGPERFNTWPLIRQWAEQSPRRLEVGPGLRPRLPIEGTHFADISQPALETLAKAGGRVCSTSIGHLPYAEDSFDLICALDILEHVEKDDLAVSELSRVATPGATVLLSVPLHPECWTPFDGFVGHYRRYEPEQLVALLNDHGLIVEQSTVFGMKPKSSRLVDFFMWFLINRRKRALWWYNNVFMPLGLRFQKRLSLFAGMVNTDGVDDIFLVCRRSDKSTD
ncbi:MAG: class I SAM-dependent methyltransferase [Opitutales bacterium]